jgi:murein DD-endopeptidase MepM/ murein hydrolase activator NlpD
MITILKRMQMRCHVLLYAAIAAFLCLLCIADLFFTPIVYGVRQRNSVANRPEQILQAQRVAPFLHRPYYGYRTVLQRTVSFFDHDKPWYVPDNVFVRFDGARWSDATLMGCIPGVSCYDGHNGYDLNLYYEPVLSAAAGTVIRAGWYNPLDHSSAFGLWVAIDHGNGYVTAYGHLSAIAVKIGSEVGIQQRIGTSGSTGASIGPHLHFGTYYLPYWLATDPFGWRGRYADPNIVPDYYLWVKKPGAI